MSINSPWDSDAQLLTWLATCVSVFSFLFYYRSGQIMLYGDAVAHINIARRVFDSKTPGLLQLGTVWLPLPHLLMLPFLISDEMWRRGVGGSIPSMAAYVFGVAGIFRLVRGILSRNPDLRASARAAAWIAAIVYAANPNLIYMQATAMGESLYLALFIWAVVFFSEWQRGDTKALTKCGFCLAAACLTRYDGWFLAAAMAATVLSLRVFAPKAPPKAQSSRSEFPHSKAQLAKFLLLAASAPALWLAYNGIVYRNPLEFENGPYSAKAIEKRTQASGTPGHPGSGSLLVAAQYFVKAGESNMAENRWLGRLWIALAIAAGVASLHLRNAGSLPEWLPLLFLPAPLLFYALSIANAGVPIFVPAFWPFTHYNVRYGLQLLPAFAVAMGILFFLVLRFRELPRKFEVALLAVLCAFLVVSYGSIWRAGPICLSEAEINMRNRNQLEARLASWLQTVPGNSTLLMYLGDHVGALQRAGIPLRRVINEGNHRVWMQPEDPDGLWERALGDPTRYADYAVAFEGDRVWQAVHGLHLKALVEIHVTGQAPAILYRARSAQAAW